MKNQMKKILLAVAMVVVVAAGSARCIASGQLNQGSGDSPALPKALAAM